MKKNFSLYKSQLASSNYKFNTNFDTYSEIDFRNYLLFGKNFSIKESFKKEEDSFFNESGYCFMYDHKSNAKLSIDVGPIGDTISAAHGHSDIFHFNFQLNNNSFFIDPGTYQYHTKDEFWRNYFRGISAHNTVSINNKNHATVNGRMSWVDCPETKIDNCSFVEEESSCKATTNAFIKDGVVHSRAFKINKKNQEYSY